MLIKMSLMLLGTSLLSNFASNASPGPIPSREEQANLLLNVQEVFEHVKVLVKDEGSATDDSVVYDIDLMVKRAQYTLDLFTELTLTHLSCKKNDVCAFGYKPKIRKILKEGKSVLQKCTDVASQAISLNSNRLLQVTNNATDHGQSFLDALGICSRKPGLAVIGCYKNIITTDVVPVKRTLLGAIDAHRVSHLKSIEIRSAANECIDNTMEEYQDKIENELERAMNCT